MGYHKKVDGNVWGSFPNGNTLYHADGTESTFFQSNVWYKEKGTDKDEPLFEIYVHNDGTKLFRFDEKRLKELGFKIETNLG
jgi:hypothetical protein